MTIDLGSEQRIHVSCGVHANYFAFKGPGIYIINLGKVKMEPEKSEVMVLDMSVVR